MFLPFSKIFDKTWQAWLSDDFIIVAQRPSFFFQLLSFRRFFVLYFRVVLSTLTGLGEIPGGMAAWRSGIDRFERLPFHVMQYIARFCIAMVFGLQLCHRIRPQRELGFVYQPHARQRYLHVDQTAVALGGGTRCSRFSLSSAGHWKFLR